jgi:K+-sensing histidine kinase KdpD
MTKRDAGPQRNGVFDEAFFDRVTHDLRGELATILAGAHFLLRYESSLGESARSMLDRVRAAARRLERLVGELGHAAWLEDGSPSLRSEPLSLHRLCDAVREAEAPFASSRNVTVAAATEDAELLGDAGLLAIALRLALDLAVARSRGCEVSMSAGVEHGRAVVRVRDHAGRIEPTEIGKLLEPFAEKAVLGTEEGARRKRLGLGLAIASGILKAHGGSLEARATSEDDGLELVCRLPATAA